MRWNYVGDRFTLVTRTAVLVVNVIAIVFLVIPSVLLQQYYDGGDTGIVLLQLAPVGWSLLWTITSLGLNFKGKRYHPGIDIPMEFFGWGLVVGTVWLLIFVIAVYGYNIDDYCQYYSQQIGVECSPVRSGVVRASEIIASVMIISLGLLHFTLFVRACRAVDRKRMQAWANRNASCELADRGEPVKN